MTDQQLIDGAKSGSEVAVRALYDRYSPRVYATVLRLAGDPELAADWAQEAWISVLRALPDFRGSAKLSTWIHRIAVNAALQGIRRQKRWSGREAPLPARPLEDPRRDRPLLRLRLEEALAKIPAGMRQILILHDLEGYTHAEIAERLGLSPGTSKSQLFKARARMRALMGDSASIELEIERCHT